MTKSFILGLILLFICSILSCQNNEALTITELKYEIQCNYIFLCWYTNEEALSTVYTCTTEGTCQAITSEPEMDKLHQFSICTDSNVTKYQIKVVNSAGEEYWQEFGNPYTGEIGIVPTTPKIY